MECLTVTEPGGPLELDRAPVPAIGPTDVLVDVDATSVGLTVYNKIHGSLTDSSLLPRIPGHEVVGRVAEIGEGVTSVEPGEFVGAYFYLSCGYCDPCRRAREPLCENLAGQVGVEIDGGFAEYVRLPEPNVITLAADLDPIAASAIPDAIATPYHIADRRAAIAPGDAVLVLGAGGGVGIHLVQMARYFGGTVTAVDQTAEKLEACAELGADAVLDTTERPITDLEARFDVIVDFTGSMALIEDAVGLLGRHGRFVHLASAYGRTYDVAPRALVGREIDVVGSRYCSKYELRRCSDLVADGVIEPIVTEVVDLGGVPELLDAIASGAVIGRGAVTPGGSPAH